MAFPFLTVFLIFLIFLNVKKHAAEKKEKESRNLFWEREDLANSTPKKDISSLNYILIPLNELPTPTSEDSADIHTLYQKLTDLSSEQILNLTGYSNTDLKITYGYANLQALMKFDQNFTFLCKLLHQLGELYHQNESDTKAIQFLEFAVSCQSDISGTYLLLAQLYTSRNQQYRIPDLIGRAQNLKSLSREIIIRHLTEFVHTEV